ncbi:MAG: nickel-dependent hydrogenase large subunit, partial [Patescibacteria group bacterium]|nr:nickel-dependent hydrogenase large subunit [Patescibacteria group bacterium]
TEAPRGAIGHWAQFKNGKIINYQIMSPTTWNASPADSNNIPGPLEKALQGTPVKNESNPIEALRIVRSFDPCPG